MNIDQQPAGKTEKHIPAVDPVTRFLESVDYSKLKDISTYTSRPDKARQGRMRQGKAR